MKITNYTKINTATLRTIAKRVADVELEEDQIKILHLIFRMHGDLTAYPLPEQVVYSNELRQAAAEIRQRYTRIIVITSRSPVALAHSLAWEMLQAQGEDIVHQRSDWDRYQSWKPYEWAKEYSLADKPVKQKPVIPMQERRYQLVLEGIERWNQRQKEANERWNRETEQCKRRLAKLRKRQRYYERTLKRRPQ